MSLTRKKGDIKNKSHNEELILNFVALARTKHTMRRSLNFRGFSYCFFRRESAFGVNQVRSKNGVNEGRFAQARLTYIIMLDSRGKE